MMFIHRNSTGIHNVQERGFTLLEVLVALLVLSIGLLGLAMLQTASMKYNTDSYFRTQATFMAYDMIDRIRANATALGSYAVPNASTRSSKLTTYNGCRTGTCNCDNINSTCDATNLATYDVGTWYNDLEAILPTDTAANPSTIVVNSATSFTVTINWRERDINKQQTWDIQL